MMVHPSLKDMSTSHIRALRQYLVHYRGREGHASRPFHALNASAAATIAQVSIGLLRQQLRDTDRVHTVLRDAGGAVNVILRRATIECMVRADALAEVDSVWRRVEKCMEAGALESGVEILVEGPTFGMGDFHYDEPLATMFKSNAERFGRTSPEYTDQMVGSTDMADISAVFPAFHPMLSYGLPPECGARTAAFADASGGPEGDWFIADAGLAMAHTISELLLSPIARAGSIERRPGPGSVAVISNLLRI